MGLSNANTCLLLRALKHGKQKPKVLTIGRQKLTVQDSFLRRLMMLHGVQIKPSLIRTQCGNEGSEFLRLMGAASVDELDASPYEGASIIHDLNCPIGRELHEQFDLVYDGGTIEHVFDVRQALLNYTNLVAAGGTLAVSTAGNNQIGHGFYQFSPELMFRVFSKENGWESTDVWLCAHQRRRPAFWRVNDPALTGGRIQIQCSEQLYLMTIARKSGGEKAMVTPQQSDYVSQWNRMLQESSEENIRSNHSLPARIVRKIRWHFRHGVAKLRRPRCYQKSKGLGQKGLTRVSWNKFVGKSETF